MTDNETEARLVRLEYAQSITNKRLDNIEPSLTEIKNILRTIKWVSIGILFGLATAAMDWGIALKIMGIIL